MSVSSKDDHSMDIEDEENDNLGKMFSQKKMSNV